MTSRSGILDDSLCLRCVIFWNKDLGECGSASREFIGVIAGLADCCEPILEECVDDAKERASEGTEIVAGSSSSVNKKDEGADTSGGSGSSSSEAMEWVVVTEAIVSREG
jgi:hypothetical protein